MNTILFPTDFSGVSLNAIDYVADIARIMSARVILLYAVRSFADRDHFISPVAIDNESQAEAALHKLAEKFSSDISCQYLVRTGSVANEIARLAKEAEVSLIVMGTSGAGEIPDTLAVLNSTTTELMGRKICPVLAVPAGARANPIRKIVLALDAEPVMATVLAPLARFAKDVRAEVLLLTVFTENNTSEDTNLANNNAAIEDLLAGIPVSMHTLKADDVAEGIRHFAESQQADLITAVARKRGFFELLFHASISQKLALRSQIPILILPE